MEKLRTCFFTGHRKIADSILDEIKIKLTENIEKLIIDYDVNNFISGGALGFDTISAEIVCEMKKKYPHIKLIRYVPCYGQSKKWTSYQKYRYRMMMSNADEIVYITDKEYTDNCMKMRNMKMVEDSFFCIAFCILSKTGTGQTIRLAEAHGNRIINIADDIY